MRVSPVNFFQHNAKQSFNGIKHLSYRDNYDDHTQGVMVDVEYYDYYPFKNESPEEIKKNTEPADRTEFISNLYPSYSSHTGEIINLMPVLDITQEAYEALKAENLNDETIIKIFA